MWVILKAEHSRYIYNMVHEDYFSRNSQRLIERLCQFLQLLNKGAEAP